jgi:hypothetical protein
LKKPRPIKVAKNLPPPPILTEEDFKKIEEESEIYRKAVTEATKDLEWLTGDDLKIVIK